IVKLSARVTVPGVFSNTARPCFQAELVLPFVTVQLVLVLFQVPLPPPTTPLFGASLPSQNSKRLVPLTTRLTWFATEVWILKAARVTPAGIVPIVMVLLVRVASVKSR